MAYNVFVSRYSNNSDIIKNSFSRSTSNAMSAYISDRNRYDMNLEKSIGPKEGRDEGEVTFSALLLPSDMPESNLATLGIDDITKVNRVKNRFINDSDVIGKDHFIVQDDDVIATLWSLSDMNIKSIEQNSAIYKNRETKLRLYNLYLFTSPAAHKHFPPELNVTVDDLREIDERVIYEICDEFFLSKGFAVELGRHQNKENIIHYHVQTTNRIFKYKYENQDVEFDHFDFVAWLSKSKLEPLRISVIKNEKNMKSWQEKFNQDPSEYNQVRLENWTRKLKELKQDREDIQDIIAGLKKTGITYSKYQDIYLKNQQRRVLSTIENDSIFSSHKGEQEVFLDTYFALDLIKERYAQVLNRLLVEAKLIRPNTELYQYSKSLRDFITVKEGRIWNISDDKRVEINKTLSQVFNLDSDFFLYELDKKGKKKKIDRKKKTRKRLIIHGLKTIIKQHLQVHKPMIVQSDKALNIWVSTWKKQLEKIKSKYSKLIDTLLQHHIYNFDWRKTVKSNLVTLQEYCNDSNETSVTLESNINNKLKNTDIDLTKQSEVIDIEFDYDYDDEDEINYENSYQAFDEEDEESEPEHEESSPQNSSYFSPTWIRFHELLWKYEAEIKKFEMRLDYDSQVVDIMFYYTEIQIYFSDLHEWMEVASSRYITLGESIYLHNPEFIPNDSYNYNQREWER